ncbi:hypothetical protein BpHYR1_054078 [Brachionus plicatilis]|uniref:Uncharacterized protein n=1 Tax=Brachionus plicatilis TaxID=10195 RepID=A0A3M7PN56_BRAPC|nr:hypothetical protein BpHYR1_054078 [Brachionus plicatilis]
MTSINKPKFDIVPRVAVKSLLIAVIVYKYSDSNDKVGHINLESKNLRSAIPISMTLKIKMSDTSVYDLGHYSQKSVSDSKFLVTTKLPRIF